MISWAEKEEVCTKDQEEELKCTIQMLVETEDQVKRDYLLTESEELKSHASYENANMALAIQTGNPPEGLTPNIRCGLSNASPETCHRWEEAQKKCALIGIVQNFPEHHVATIAREKETQYGLQAQLEHALRISSLPEADPIFLERKNANVKNETNLSPTIKNSGDKS